MQIAPNFTFKLLISASRQIVNVVDSIGLALDSLRPETRMQVPETGHAVTFAVGSRCLQGWLVPAISVTRASVLICHGIADRMHYWRRVQHMLAAHGVTSLIFDYAGYGKSEGATTPANLEEDARCAYQWLHRSTNLGASPFLLGFSMGTGVASQIAQTLHPPPSGIVLCQAYPSFRAATGRVVHPFAALSRLMPDIWQTERHLATCPLPLLLVHGTEDRLFPPSMALKLHAIARLSGAPATLALIPGCGHNAIYRAVPELYWEPILSFMERRASRQPAQR